MPCNCSLVFRIALVACMAGVSCITLTTAPRTSAAASLTWYWQNPLPRAYSMSAIACPTANACVTVGQGGSIITTTDGGHHWTSRRSGTTAALFFVACPSRAVCYTVGSTKGPGQVVDVLLKSVDGGATWSRPSQHVSLGALLLGGPSLVCPTMTTCLLVSWVGGTGHILRTADGGRTWRSAHDGEGTVTCPTTHICYAASGHMLFRSVDAGATWTTQSKVPGNAAGFLGALACPAANTCLVALGVCLDCGDADALHTLSRAAASAQEWVDLFLTRDGGKTWRHVDRAGSGDARSLACGSATTCYASGSPDVLETVDGGQTWSAHPFPVTGLIHEVTCPGATTCYAAADFTALKTTDGFRHILQTPATSRIGGARLAEISCPTAATCYANTFAAEMVTTADAGKTWTVMPGRPMNDFRCPTSTSCYGFVLLSPGRGKATQALFFRSSDGAKTWQQFTVPVQTLWSRAPGLSGGHCMVAGARLRRLPFRS